MGATSTDLIKALREVELFIGSSLSARIADLEKSVRNCGRDECSIKSLEAGATSELLAAAYSVKEAAGQINVLIHAVGSLQMLTKIRTRRKD